MKIHVGFSHDFFLTSFFSFTFTTHSQARATYFKVLRGVSVSPITLFAAIITCSEALIPPHPWHVPFFLKPCHNGTHMLRRFSSPSQVLTTAFEKPFHQMHSQTLQGPHHTFRCPCQISQYHNIAMSNTVLLAQGPRLKAQ